MVNWNLGPIESSYKWFLNDLINEKIQIERNFISRTIESAARIRDGLFKQIFEKYCEKIPECIPSDYLKHRGYSFVKDENDIMWFEKYGIRYSPKFKISSKVDTSTPGSFIWSEVLNIVEV